MSSNPAQASFALLPTLLTLIFQISDLSHFNTVSVYAGTCTRISNTSTRVNKYSYKSGPTTTTATPHANKTRPETSFLQHTRNRRPASKPSSSGRRSGTKKPRTSLAYCLSLLTPSDSHNAAMKAKSPPSRSTFYIALWLLLDMLSQTNIPAASRQNSNHSTSYASAATKVRRTILHGPSPPPE